MLKGIKWNFNSAPGRMSFLPLDAFGTMAIKLRGEKLPVKDSILLGANNFEDCSFRDIVAETEKYLEQEENQTRSSRSERRTAK